MRLPGGELVIEWRAADDHVLMTGPVEFEGEFTLDDALLKPRRRDPGRLSTKRGRCSCRVDAIDCARGFALIGMAVFHLCWDLADFRLVPPLLPFTPPMRLLSHRVASVFLALVGVSLALAHRKAELRAFWRGLRSSGARPRW